MRIRYVSGTLGMFFTLFSNAQVVSDTIKSVDLSAHPINQGENSLIL